MKDFKQKTVEGGEAVVHVAYRVSEVCSIYPITPSSSMAEQADIWASAGIKNIFGVVPDVIEMQSEGGAAGTAHGALQTGAMTTTFTSSQGLLLMLPNMYKIAGELTPCVFHVAARALAASSLSIFGDHQDVMSARMTGFAMLVSNSVQEAHDMALISHAATLKSRIPFMHFFDGFRTSHEINKITMIDDENLSLMIDNDLIYAHRKRALNPDNPFIRGTAQNPDVYFQGRESVNPYYQNTPQIVQQTMDKFATLTGRQYKIFEYTGSETATNIIIIMGSGTQTVQEVVKKLNLENENYGVLLVRLFRPFSDDAFLKELPKTVKNIAVLDRTKEPGSNGEPLYQQICTSIFQAYNDKKIQEIPKIIGGRYGLSSKEFTPAMVISIFDEMQKEKPKNNFTIGINDDVSHTSLEYDKSPIMENDGITAALFYGLGSDGTVGANKNSIKIIGENTALFAQGYFVYDSKKAGAQTVSHLRFGNKPINSPYLIQSASFVACHSFNFLFNTDMLDKAADNAVFLLNTTFAKNEIWQQLPENVQQTIIDKNISLYIVDALEVAQKTNMGKRINTIMQTCFFAISGVLPKDEAISHIKNAIKKTYFRKGETIIKQNYEAVDQSLQHMQQVDIPQKINSIAQNKLRDMSEAPIFFKEVTSKMIAGLGDDLPVSAIPEDGTYPSGTTRYEKRNIADFIPLWREDLCIQCGNCAFVCPHAVIRAKFYHQDFLKITSNLFKSAPISARGFPDTRYSLQIYGEDCTGCGVCVESCPVQVLENGTKIRAINMQPKPQIIKDNTKTVKDFEKIPFNSRSQVDFSSVRGAQFLEPLFEFSGACAGCGETPYVKLLSQLFGPRALIANATGCSSIYGGNLPTTPWAKNTAGQGPAWSNSLFEDNAEFGLGMRVSADFQLKTARILLQKLKDLLPTELVNDILNSKQHVGSQLRSQRQRVEQLKRELIKIEQNKDAKNLLSMVNHLVRRSVWLLGGDGWAYDIGSGGLDHVLASGRDVNVLVMDTEVYSNTGGQMSKSTPLGSSAKFASAGKRIGKKDLALQAISYGNVYVARVAFGSNPQQTLDAMREAEEYKGPSLILAFSPCIAHGYDLRQMLEQQDLAVASGYWPLIRYNPTLRAEGKQPFIMDSPRPKIPLEDYAYNEARFNVLLKTHPEDAKHLMEVAQEQLDLRMQTYEHMAQQSYSKFQPIA
ncbi:MAG: pyruvate:ferredoxin (flavodoxin) oxidoreductase [Gammaproteobacteria bacterium]|nr:MAG: pyruvate:ferredoxin (flavodoxin) oxidoreductase [Gammaproteobacteria bacterium]